MGKKNITFSDIAKYTGFSKTTISRYFNNPDSLTLENQQIIATALEKLNYKENKVARILANGKTEFIGIIIPNLYMHYYSEILNQILKTYDSFGYKFLVFTDTDDHFVHECQGALNYGVVSDGKRVERSRKDSSSHVYAMSSSITRLSIIKFCRSIVFLPM